MLENINIEEIGGKTFKIAYYQPFEKAILTHYLHNYHNGVSKYFKKDATEILKSYFKYKKDVEKVSFVKEDAMQRLLFEVENVPFPTSQNHTFKFIDLFA